MSENESSKLFLKGCNCAQSVFVPYAKQFGIDENIALKLSNPLGGGVGRMRNVCGAFSAMAMIAGLKYSSSEINAENKKDIYALVQKLAKIFEEKNGSIICSKLLKLQEEAKNSPQPQVRDANYYKDRPCLGIVDSAAKIVEEYILTGKITQI